MTALSDWVPLVIFLRNVGLGDVFGQRQPKIVEVHETPASSLISEYMHSRYLFLEGVVAGHT